MKLTKQFLQVSEPEVWAMFLGKDVIIADVENYGDEFTKLCEFMAIESDGYGDEYACSDWEHEYYEIRGESIYLTRSQVAEMMKPVLGEWCFLLLPSSICIEKCNGKKADFWEEVGFNQLTIQAEKQSILRDLIEWVKEAE